MNTFLQRVSRSHSNRIESTVVIIGVPAASETFLAANVLKCVKISSAPSG
jgi:hypothetical protein